MGPVGNFLLTKIYTKKIPPHKKLKKNNNCINDTIGIG